MKDRIGFVDSQFKIGVDEVNKNLPNYDILLCDRGYLDTFVWYNMYFKMGLMDKDRYLNSLKQLKKSLSYNSHLYSLWVDANTSMLRNYSSSISIESRSTMNQTNVEKYNKSLKAIESIIKPKIDKFDFIDTSNSNILDPSIKIANDILNEVKRLYLERKN